MNRFLYFISTVIILTACDTSSNVQPRNEPFFFKVYSGVNKGNQFGDAIIETADGGLLVAGTSYNDNDSSEMILLKLLPNGDLDWKMGSDTILTNMSAASASIVEVSDGYIIGGSVEIGSLQKAIILKVGFDGPSSLGQVTYNILDQGSPYNNVLKKITVGESGLLVSGDTDNPYDPPNAGEPVDAGANGFFCLVNPTDLSIINKGGQLIHYIGLGANEFITGAYEVRDKSTNVGANNINFLVFGTTDVRNDIKNFFYIGYNNVFLRVNDLIIEDSGADQLANDITEFNDTYWMIGDSDKSQIYIAGWEYNSSSDLWRNSSTGTDEVTTREDAIGISLDVTDDDSKIIVGDLLYAPNEHEEILLGAINKNFDFRGNWPLTFGNASTAYSASDVIVLTDGSIVTLGTADLDPIRKIVVIKTGPNGETSF